MLFFYMWKDFDAIKNNQKKFLMTLHDVETLICIPNSITPMRKKIHQ